MEGTGDMQQQQQQQEEQPCLGHAHAQNDGAHMKESHEEVEGEEEDDLFFTQTQEDEDEEWEPDPEDGGSASLPACSEAPHCELGAKGKASSMADPLRAQQQHQNDHHHHQQHHQQQHHRHHHQRQQQQQQPAALAPPTASNANAAASATPSSGPADSSPVHATAAAPHSPTGPTAVPVTSATTASTSNTADTRHFYTFLGDKAGMDENKRSKEEVERIVHEASKNSKFFLAQQKNDVKIQERIRAIQAKLRTLSEPLRRSLELEADKRLLATEKACRSTTQVCVVVDLDAFFTSVEERDNPSLKTLPFAVGGGVVCTANYEARKYGVRSAMPEFIARKLCPQLVVRPTRFETYSQVAEQTRAIFREYDPHFRAGSLDEAYLDLTAWVQGRVREGGREVPVPRPGGGGRGGGGGALFEEEGGLMVGGRREEEEEEEEEEDGDEQEERERGREREEERERFYWSVAEEVVAEIRRRIKEVTGVTASAGIATSFCLAKIASNERKPDGQFRVGDVRGFLRELPVRKVSGIGRITERCLVAGLEIQTCYQLWAKRALLYHVYTRQTAHWLVCKSVGLDGGGPDDGGNHDEGGGGGGGGGSGRKGISRERTFAALSRKEDLLEKLRLISDSLAADMAREGLKAKSITLKLKDSSFAVTTRAKSCAFYVSTSQELYQHALSLLLPQLPITLRLMGVRASHFQPKPQAPPKGKGCLEGYVVTTGPGAAAVAAGASTAGAAAAAVGDNSLSSSSSSSFPPAAAAAGAAARPKPKAPAPPTYSCPLCARRLSVGLQEFNQHVDACLRASDPHFSRREKEEEEEREESEKEERERRKHDTQSVSSGANKKAKRNGGGGGREGGGKKGATQPVARPLEHFFPSSSSSSSSSSTAAGNAKKK